MRARLDRPSRPRPRALGRLLGLAPALLAPALLAAACVSGTDETSAAAEARFDRARAWGDLERMVALGPRPAGSPALEQLRVWLEAELVRAGLQPRREAFRDETPEGPVDFTNVYADLEAPERAGRPAPMILIAAHIDTKRLPFPFVGANDGAAGTAVLLEVARALAAAPRPRAVALRFLFVDGEEAVRHEWVDPDNRYGSRHHARMLRERGELARVKAAVVIDLVGDADLLLNTDSFSDRRIQGLFVEAARTAGLGKHVGGPAMETRDDHLSFMEAGIPSYDMIDFSYGPANEYWHGPGDVPANCSAESLEAAGRIFLLGLPGLEAWVLER